MKWIISKGKKHYKYPRYKFFKYKKQAKAWKRIWYNDLTWCGNITKVKKWTQGRNSGYKIKFIR